MPAVMRLEGAAELRRALRRLGNEIGPQVLGEAIDAGSAVFRDAIEARAPLGRTGNLRAGWRVRKRTFYRGTVRGGVNRTKKAAHAHLVEFGHRVVRAGRVVGHAAAHPFIRPAFEAARPRAEQLIDTALRRGIDARWGR